MASRGVVSRNNMIKQTGPQVLPKRKHPIHMPPLERPNVPVILFVTLAVQPRGNYLANPIIHKVFRDACREADSWSVGRYVIMPDHVHLFCRSARWSVVPVKRWSGYLKERFTKRIKVILKGETMASRDRADGSAQRRPPVICIPWKWQSDCWDTQMRGQQHYSEKWEYVRQNPVRKGLVAREEDWPWQGELNVLGW